jgi:ribose-phosphate pyrophosphokinase
MMPADRSPLIFAPDPEGVFARALSEALRLPLSPCDSREFEDGEHKCRPTVNVRGRDVYVVQALHGDADRTVNDKLLRLLLFIGTLADASAARITAVLPYLPYSRKDRRTRPRDPVTTRYIAQLLEAVGTHCVVTLDVHNLSAYENAFRCRAEHLEASSLFVSHFASRVGSGPVAVVSPDEGGIKRAEDFRRRLCSAIGRPVGTAFAEKYRIAGQVSGEALVGDVDGCTAILVDDMISTGTTLSRAARACRAHGAVRVLAAASHGVFAPESNTVLADAGIDAIAVTDTIPLRYVTDEGLRSRIVPLSVAPLFAEAIRRLHADESLSELADL